MRIEIEIPKEFECDYDMEKFRDFFSRVLHDISKGRLCGKYEQEIAEMLQKAFEESKPAYDVEAVVAELEKEKAIHTEHFRISLYKDYPGIKQMYEKVCLVIDKAISIVRGKE